jgi:hypothetical protein
MSDLEYLYTVMAVFYLWECTHWLRSPSASFVAWIGRSFRASQPFFVANGRDGGLHFASPLPVAGTFLITSEWPLALAPQGLVNRTGTRILFADQPQFAARRHRLLVGDQELAVLGSPCRARAMANQLNDMCAVPEEIREEHIRTWLADTLDAGRLADRQREFNRAAKLPTLLATLLVLLVFVGTPAILSQLGLATSWPWLLAGLTGLSVANAVVFLRAHRKLHPGLTDERFACFLMVLLFPPAGMRTRDLLSRPLMESFHPLAAAQVLCSLEDTRTIAGAIVRDLKYPRPVQPSPPGEDIGIRQWFREAALEAVRRTVEPMPIGLDALLAPPARADAGSASYCPRCQAQFTRVTGTCSDCGVTLAPF